MDLNKRADISRRYLLQKGETVSAKTIEDLVLALNSAKESLSAMRRERESQRQSEYSL